MLWNEWLFFEVFINYFPKIHGSVLHKIAIDLLYFWDIYDINLWENFLVLEFSEKRGRRGTQNEVIVFKIGGPKGNPNSQGILNWIIQILHYYYWKQHKNIENSQIIEQNLVISLSTLLSVYYGQRFFHLPSSRVFFSVL